MAKTATRSASGAKAKVKATATVTGAAAVAAEPKKKFNLVAFLAKYPAEVRAEARKISWPTRKETWITTVMVFIMVVIASVFFFVVDGVIAMATEFVLKLGR